MSRADDLQAAWDDDAERELLGVWLSRRMFGWMIGPPFEEDRDWLAYRAAAIEAGGKEATHG